MTERVDKQPVTSRYRSAAKPSSTAEFKVTVILLIIVTTAAYFFLGGGGGLTGRNAGLTGRNASEDKLDHACLHSVFSFFLDLLSS